MGTLYLIRHGQASFGSDDYDQLSALGERQSAQLGRWMSARGLRFQAVLHGTLRRHRQTLQAIAGELAGLPASQALVALDEYDSHAVLRTVMREALPAAHTTDGYKQHFRLLREGLLKWAQGQSQPEGMPSWPGFVAGVAQALDLARAHHPGDVLLVSSGGPIAVAIAHVLGAPASAAIELNMRLRNSAITEFAFTPNGCSLLSYNGLPHLDHPDRRDWVTYA